MVRFSHTMKGVMETMIGMITERRNMGNVDENQAPYLFGELLKLAVPHVKSYGSDLYHDALCVKGMTDEFRAKDDTAFSLDIYYQVGECGTHLFRDVKDATACGRVYGSTWYKLTLDAEAKTYGSRMYYLTIQEISLTL